MSTQHLNFRRPDSIPLYSHALRRNASGRIAVIRCIPLPLPPRRSRSSPLVRTYKSAHARAYIHARKTPDPFLKFDRIRNGARYLPTRISRTASLFSRIYRPWIIGSLRRMIGYTKFDSPRRLFFIPRSISAVRLAKRSTREAASRNGQKIPTAYAYEAKIRRKKKILPLRRFVHSRARRCLRRINESFARHSYMCISTRNPSSLCARTPCRVCNLETISHTRASSSLSLVKTRLACRTIVTRDIIENNQVASGWKAEMV